MKSTVLLVLLVSLCSTAAAGTHRLRVHASTGELVETARPCGKEMRTLVWRQLFKGLYVEVTDAAMLVAVGTDRQRRADRFVPGLPNVVGFYEGDGKTFAVTVRRGDIVKGQVVVELSILIGSEPAPQCSEKWVGLATLL